MNSSSSSTLNLSGENSASKSNSAGNGKVPSESGSADEEMVWEDSVEVPDSFGSVVALDSLGSVATRSRSDDRTPEALSLSYDQTPDGGMADSLSDDQMLEGGTAETLNLSGKNLTKKALGSADTESHSSDRALERGMAERSHSSDGAREGGMADTLKLRGVNKSDRVAKGMVWEESVESVECSDCAGQEMTGQTATDPTSTVSSIGQSEVIVHIGSTQQADIDPISTFGSTSSSMVYPSTGETESMDLPHLGG
jgi:hypothetical protein